MRVSGLKVKLTAQHVNRRARVFHFSEAQLRRGIEVSCKSSRTDSRGNI